MNDAKAKAMIDIFESVIIDLGQTKKQLSELRTAFDRRDDFIRWLIEIKLDDEYSLDDLWDEFERYETDEFEKYKNQLDNPEAKNPLTP